MTSNDPAPRDSRDSLSPSLAAAIFALGVALFVAVVAAAGAWHERSLAVDDAFISYRYAHHLALGAGLRWNLDAPPNEGFTNLLYVLGVAAGDALGVDPVVAGVAIGIAGVVAIVALLAVANRPRSVAAPLGAVLLMFVLARPELRVHASRGLETTLFAALAVAVVMLGGRVARAERRCVGAAIGLAVVSLLLVLCRPDGVLIVAPTWAIVGVAHLLRRRRGRGRFGDVAIGGAVGFVLLGAYAAWNLAYFGYLLPNSFYAKATAGDWAGAVPTLRFFAEYAAPFVIGVAVMSLQIALALRRRRKVDHAAAPLAPFECVPVLVLAILALWTLYSCRIVHEMGFSYRFDWPMVPLLALGSIAALHDLVRDRTPTPRLRLAALALGVLGACASIPAIRNEFAALAQPAAVDPYTTRFARLGRSLHDVAAGRPLTLVCGHAGATPYYAEVHHVDPGGLVDDRFNSRTPPADRERYRLELRPDVILWHLFPAEKGSTTLDSDARAMASTYLQRWCLGGADDADAAAAHARSTVGLKRRKYEMYEKMAFFRDGCTLIGEIDYGLPRWREFVYVWNDSPRRDELVERLRACVDIPADAITYDGWPAASR